ncbi:trypsin-like peptidase domain-containing protein [Streptomyces monomycini]|uniref:trypsin-like peptidase domain-containing protein n=2 Tax=Streptomyces monomycini TaxID=371720 RepID=UPI00067B2E14
MDEGTAAGPKRNWWSRSGQLPAEPSEQAPAAPGPTAPDAEAAAATREFPALPGEAGAAPGTSPDTGQGAGTGAPHAPGRHASEQPVPQGVEQQVSVPQGAESQVSAPHGSEQQAPAPHGSEQQVPAPPSAPPTAPPRQPLHPQDPYGTPPYGDPGPWAPAPPVQRPTATPAQGTGVPPQGAGPAPQAAAPAPQGAAPMPAGQQAGYGTGAPVAPPQQPFTAQQRPPAGPQSYEGSAARTPMPQAEPSPTAAQPPHGQPSPAQSPHAEPSSAQSPQAPSAPHPAGATPPPGTGTDTTQLTAGDGARLPAGARDTSGGAPLPPEAHGAPQPPHAPPPGPGGTEPQPGAPADGQPHPPHQSPQPHQAHQTPPQQPHHPHPPHPQAGQQPHWQQYDPWRAAQHGAAMPLGTPPPPPPAPRRNRRGALAAGAVVLALLAGGVGGGVGAYIERNGGLGSIELPQDTGDQGGRKPDSVAGIAQAALPSVVTLHVRGNSEQGTGTGFVLDKQGHILTNNHVVEPAGTGGEISVSFSGGQTAKAKVIGRDGGYDLAVVQVQGVSGLRPLALGDSDSVRVGDPVVAIGAPYDLANTVTAGIISAKQRPITAGGKKGDGSDISYVDALQTDAPINPGNSGGPLVDSRARVIGINSAIRAAGSSGGGLDGGGQGGSIGLGFAIPINQGKWVAEQLINKGKVLHPVIGVTLEMEYAGDGARVSSKSKDGGVPVTPGGPGDKAGIKPRDVITKVDGQPVHSGEELIIKIRSHRPGDRLTLTLRRDGKEQTAQLTLGAAGQE